MLEVTDQETESAAREPSEREWIEFLSIVAAGEMVAASKCRTIAEHMELSGREEIARLYRGFQADEKRHFRLLAQASPAYAPIPEYMSRLFRGELLSDPTSVAETMALTHLVFETAALSYLSHFTQFDFSSRPALSRLPDAAASILRDEAKHVVDGADSIKECFPESLEGQARAELLASLDRHASELFELPYRVFGASSPFADSLSRRFASYFQTAKKRVFA
jgi:hypothetical protein